MICNSRYWKSLCLLFSVLALFAGCAGGNKLNRGTERRKAPQVTVVSTTQDMPHRTCDMRIQLKISDPIAPYLENQGKIELFGPDGLRMERTFAVKFGTQLVIIPDLEAGRYTVQVSYGTIIASKCVILGCICVDNWREVFANAAMQDLSKDVASCATCTKYSYTGGAPGGANLGPYGSASLYSGSSSSSKSGAYWGGNSSYSQSADMVGWGDYEKSDEIKGSGKLEVPCSQVTPCGRNVEFELPKDSK